MAIRDGRIALFDRAGVRLDVGAPVGIAPGLLARVRPGAYALASEWEQLYSEMRLRTLAHAVASRQRDGLATFCRATASALWRQSVFRTRSDRVDVIVPRPYTRRDTADVVRHQEPLPENDVALIDGLRVTSLDRTVYDVIRTGSPEAGIVAFDDALRKTAWDEVALTYDHTSAEAFRTLVRERVVAGTRARGIRQARVLTELADGRTQLPGEAVSRLWMLQLGVPPPQLQLRVELGDGRFALLDQAWPERGRWMEFDGAIKIADADFMSGRTAAQVAADQHERERLVVRATGWRCDRYGFEQLASLDVFAGYLRSIGMR
ncbi:hypothetical protein [Microbacterium kyungheense]|uniref:Transcriptional regulator, AbiEi antitoxin, Type IV TA system n=1 Tax=Microbacterium kyungheense TaxID=1263636 RepID=A0A543FJH8_9MICO|nr:hypothetical protein [Microbacterium kyungheense]TQM34037.1 hypothetical protein FB391_0324 [Microbacterium kyungheense]